MTSGKKKRMSMLDSFAPTGGPSPAAANSMMSTNRALRSARDAVDAHHVWDLDPAAIINDRVNDRIDPGDVRDLRDAIEQNGQVVPILVRRHPSEPDRYLLVYGRRRLEAIRTSDKVQTVRALVASLDDQAALTTQISENMARRDLSYIEKALFAQELMTSGFGNQNRIAEVLTVTKSSISMALAIVEMVGPKLIQAIGPAHGVGRPKWETLGKAIESSDADRTRLEEIATQVHTGAAVAAVKGDSAPQGPDISVLAFEAVLKSVGPAPSAGKTPSGPPAPPTRSRPLNIAGERGGAVRRSARGVSITLDEGAFADWVEDEAQNLIEELHTRWLRRVED